MLATLKTPPNRAPRAGVRGLKTRTGFFCRRSANRAPVFGSQMPKLRRVAKLAATKSASGPTLWPSRDPIGENGGINLYGYVNNDPINWIDPDGQMAMAPAMVVRWSAAEVMAAGAAAILMYDAIREESLSRKALEDLQRRLADQNSCPLKVDATKAPGMPTEADGFKGKKNWDGKKVKNPNGSGSGFPDADGNVWVPTDHNGTHAPHWDVQNPRPPNNHKPVYPNKK